MNPKLKNKGGRPAGKVKLAKPKVQAKSPRVSLATHDDLNQAALSGLEEQLAEATELVEYTKAKRDKMAAVLDTGEVDLAQMRHLEKAESEYRQALKDKRQLWLSLTKELELLRSLAKPTDSDPLYTPIHLHIMTVPPVSVIASPVYLPPVEQTVVEE